MSTIDIPTPVPAAPAGPPPPPRYAPHQVADDTFVIQATQGEGMAPVAVHLNSMVIRGPEPIIVDTGVPPLGDRYLEDMWSLVDPADVRWVFISHDDVDHVGNLEAVMAACPNATLLTSWFMWERMGNLPFLPPWRMRWLSDGETFEANGRTYAAIRPPVYDSPTTQGLLDTGTGVYWASDCFACPVPTGTPDVAALDPALWHHGTIQMQLMNSPWVSVVDERRYHDSVDALARAGVGTIASCHGPAITGGDVARAFEMLHELPSAVVEPAPGQPVLDEIIAQALAAGPPR
ncbi:MAG TPA: MBL fold metallo-hydrolase [Iamia sp.]|nr:MBL fold metallo-hydrolase [Iamia sp.]